MRSAFHLPDGDESWRSASTSYGAVRSGNTAQDYSGEFVQFPASVMLPQPIEPIPILIGGESERALDCAARIGDGLVSLPHSVQEHVSLMAEMARRVQAQGRSPSEFQYNALCQRGISTQDLLVLADAGVSSVHVSAWTSAERSPSEKTASLQRFAETVMQPFRESSWSLTIIELLK